MKQGLKLLALAMVSLMTVTSCSDLKYDAPLLTEPKVEGLTPNITISELKKQYAGVADRTAKEIEYDYILRAVVSANDASGNIYKQIYVQDETGGIAVSIDQNEINGTYPVGQEVYIKLHGLAISVYGGQPSIGHPTADKNRIPFEIVKESLLPNGWPDADRVEPRTVRIADFSDEMVGTLVRLDNVLFEEAGQPFAPPQETVNRLITQGDGSSVVVRNSGYAQFAQDLLPQGVGSVVGVLSKFGNAYQLFLRTREDVFGFTPGKLPSIPDEPSKPDTPTPSKDEKVILQNAFNEDLAPFTAHSAEGQQSWFIKHMKDKETGKIYSSFANMSGYDGKAKKAVPNVDWLISPRLDLTGATSARLTFKHAINFFADNTKVKHHQLLVSTDYEGGDPSGATWTAVTIDLPQTPGWKFIDVSVALPSSVLGQSSVYFAFKYTSDAAAGSTWEIKELKLSTVGGGKVVGDSGASSIKSMDSHSYGIAD